MMLLILICTSTVSAIITAGMLGARARCVMLDMTHRPPEDVDCPAMPQIIAGLLTTTILYGLTLWAAG